MRDANDFVCTECGHLDWLELCGCTRTASPRRGEQKLDAASLADAPSTHSPITCLLNHIVSQQKVRHFGLSALTRPQQSAALLPSSSTAKSTWDHQFNVSSIISIAWHPRKLSFARTEDPSISPLRAGEATSFFFALGGLIYNLDTLIVAPSARVHSDLIFLCMADRSHVPPLLDFSHNESRSCIYF